MAQRLDAKAPDFEEKFKALLAQKRDLAPDVDAAVKAIIDEVIARGDAALVDYSRRFDRIDLEKSGIAVTKAEVDAAEGRCTGTQLQALDLALERILAFHERQRPQDLRFTDPVGVELGWRWTPIDSVGLYVPGGTAAYPSSVLMNVAPAKVAGVGRIAMVVPTPGGEVAPLVLAAAKRAGIEEIYRVGGAQAVAALAYGTKTIAPVDKIVGPGNAYVAAAKRRV
ncbi:MAG TPA: histidinol dehydrogenase, partial [Methylocystis sp.]|nr:histidinol dehydrogenase [Methylocystis sp.]